MKQLQFILIILFLGCKSPEARPPKTIKSGSFLKESALRNKQLNEAERLTIEKVISKQNEIYATSKYGFWYRYIKKNDNDTITPKFGDVVEFNYNISNINGQKIYSKTEIGPQTYAIDQEELFSGLREGLKLMKPNEQIKFIFPSHKAYGYYGDGKKIGRNTPLICEVTLIHINQKQNNE
jgi:gliding motility-associated peptidyl-prolyl isomerase